nr:hypothetical protein 100 [bacterium]
MSFNYIVGKSVENILANALSGKYPLYISGNTEGSLFGDGVSVNLGENKLEAFTPNTRNIVSQTPEASILVKKKAFSTLKSTNDLRFMDKTEKMLLRSTKALFAYKCSQLRTYEALTKFEDFFKNTHQINLALFVDLLNNAKFLEAATETEDLSSEQGLSLITGAVNNALTFLGFDEIAYDAYKEDVLKIIKRNAFASDNRLTTWIVDPESTDNYETGPGTGVIDLCAFTTMNTTTDLQTAPSPASFTLEDPYRIMSISEADIELAIDEAINGTIGLLSVLASGDPDAPLLDAESIVSAGIEALGLGFLDGSLDMSYIRNRMRVLYLGKNIVNANDGVHFYIRGNKTVEDLRTGEAPFDQDYLNIDDTILEAERILYTNQRVDLETYKQLRKNSDNSFGMAHVYGGYVTDVTESFSNGKWTLKVNCTDNMGWLQFARFNVEPAIDDPQGVLEDPLTPYKLETDDSGRVLSASGPQLLDENKELLQSGLLKYDSGILNGQVATETNLLQGQYNEGGSLKGAKILQHPNGFVYRWKDGIITATANLAVNDPLTEDTVSLRRHRQVYGLPVTSTDSSALGVLNNLDIANILSILIVGQPYNVETFIEQAYMANGLTSTSAASLDPTNAVTSVLDITRRQNRFLGNFRPYRMITMSNQTLEEGTSSYILRNQANASIEALRARKVRLNQILKDVSASATTGGDSGLLARTLQEEIRTINKSIKAQTDPYKDITLDSADLLIDNFNLFGNSRTLSLSGNFNADHQITRAMVLVGAQRRIEDARLNRDMNLFVVSDQYDENTDIRPYLLKFRDSNYKIFQGLFTSVYEKCEAAAKFMNLEFFCNPQGNLEFRPPQWNRTPLSVLERLFEIGEEGVIPNFLRDLFENRTASLRREIHGLNVRIAIISLLLGKYPDKTIIPGMTVSGAEALDFFGISEDTVGGQAALGVSQPFTAGFTIDDVQSLDDQLVGDGLSVNFSLGEEGDVLNGDTSTLLGVFDPVFQETNNRVFDNIVNTVGNPGGASASKVANANNLNAIRDAYRRLAGGDPAAGLIANAEFTNDDFVFTKGEETRAIGKINKYLSELSSAISERDKLVDLLTRNEEKQQELEELESILTGEFTAEDDSENFLTFQVGDTEIDAEEVLTRAKNTVSSIKDILTGDSTQGSLFDHLIEDDSRNLKGPGSGRRFVVEDHDIISCSFSESPPEFTRVDVTGNAPIIGEELQSAFEERYYWAGGTDFDLWRQYGYKYQQIDLPFASSAELQCRPFAIMELQLQRTKVLQGDITVAGNEYYEPGDVVYVKSKELLYYVKSVSHSFDYGGQSFTTQLKLDNGHPPGVYLPSPLDIIGQQLTKDPFDTQAIIYRNSNGDDKYRELRPDCAILFPNNVEITTDNINVLLDHKDNMVRFANMMIELNTLLIGNKKVLLRGFIQNSSDIHRQEVEDNLDIIKELLMNPQMIVQFDSSGLGDDFVDAASQFASGLLGVDTGSTKGLSPLILPNGLEANPVPSESIVQQIVIMSGEEGQSEIRCMDQELLSTAESGIYPLGGPKQKTWLDFRDDLTKIYKIVEVGILDINRSLEDLDSQESETLPSSGEVEAEK